MEVIFEALLNILNIYINFRILDIFLVKKEKKAFFSVIYCLAWLLNFLVYYVYDNIYLTSGSLFLLLLSAVVILYHGSLIQKIAAVFSVMALGIAVDEMIWRLFSYFGLLERLELFANLSVSLILIGLALLLEHIFVVRKNNYIAKESYVNIVLVLFGNILLIYLLSGMDTAGKPGTMLAVMILCVIDISAFWLHNKVNEVYREKLERRMMEEQILRYQKPRFLIFQGEYLNILS